MKLEVKVKGMTLYKWGVGIVSVMHKLEIESFSIYVEHKTKFKRA